MSKYVLKYTTDLFCRILQMSFKHKVHARSEIICLKSCPADYNMTGLILLNVKISHAFCRSGVVPVALSMPFSRSKQTHTALWNTGKIFLQDLSIKNEKMSHLKMSFD